MLKTHPARLALLFLLLACHGLALASQKDDWWSNDGKAERLEGLLDAHGSGMGRGIAGKRIGAVFDLGEVRHGIVLENNTTAMDELHYALIRQAVQQDCEILPIWKAGENGIWDIAPYIEHKFYFSALFLMKDGHHVGIRLGDHQLRIVTPAGSGVCLLQ